MKGFVYLTQPVEFRLTNIYKVGTEISSLSKFKNYIPEISPEIKIENCNTIRKVQVSNPEKVAQTIQREFSLKYETKKEFNCFIIPNISEALEIFDDIIDECTYYPIPDEPDYMLPHNDFDDLRLRAPSNGRSKYRGDTDAILGFIQKQDPKFKFY